MVPAKGETITLSFNDKELIKVDFPAFGLPIIEIFGEFPSSVSEIFSAMFDFKYFFNSSSPIECSALIDIESFIPF